MRSPSTGDRSPGGVAVHVCTDPGVPVFGTKGSSIHVRSVLAELVRRYDEVHLLARRTGGERPPALAGVHVHELAPPRRGRLHAADVADRERELIELDDDVGARLLDIAGDGELALVYQRYALWSCAPMEVAGRRGWRSTLELNAPLVDEQARHRTLADRATAEEMTRRAVRAAGAPFAVSSCVAAWASSLAGCPVEVVANGVDASRFEPPQGSHSGADAGAVTVGFVGTFKPWHDLDTVVDAVAALHRAPEAPAVRLLLVGDGPELGRVVDRGVALGLGDGLEATGAVPAEAIPALLARMDVGLAPYTGDEQYFSPLKVFEYLAAGVAVAASAIDGLGDQLVDGREALLVPPGDRAGFERAVHRLCSDAGLRDRLGRAGRAAAIDRLGWDRVVDHVLQLGAVAPAAEVLTA